MNFGQRDLKLVKGRFVRRRFNGLQIATDPVGRTLVLVSLPAKFQSEFRGIAFLRRDSCRAKSHSHRSFVGQSISKLDHNPLPAVVLVRPRDSVQGTDAVAALAEEEES